MEGGQEGEWKEGGVFVYLFMNRLIYVSKNGRGENMYY